MRGYACIGLDNPKYDVNVASALRAAGCYTDLVLATNGDILCRECYDHFYTVDEDDYEAETEELDEEQP